MRIIGTEGADSLDGGPGDDVIEGRGGNDVLTAVEGVDTLLGGAGDDILHLFYGEGAAMDGGAGNDTLGGFLSDPGAGVTMTGGAGADSFLISDGVHVTDLTPTDELIFQSGFNSIYVIDDQVTRTYGDEATVFEVDPLAFRYMPSDLLNEGVMFTVAGDTAGRLFVPGAGSVTNEFMSVSNTALIAPPTEGFYRADDVGVTALAAQGGERLVGLAGYGEDLLTGQGGDDTLDGGVGPDFLSGGGGSDLVLGGADADVLGGGDGADTIEGGAGDDLIYGSEGNDILFGGAGNDVLFGDGGAG